MRVLTFIIGPYRLALAAEAVAAVGKPYRGELVSMVDLAKRFGTVVKAREQSPMITYRTDQKLYEFAVDRIIGLEDVGSQTVSDWPRLLAGSPAFKGVAVIGGQLFLLLDAPQIRPAGRRKA